MLDLIAKIDIRILYIKLILLLKSPKNTSL